MLICWKVRNLLDLSNDILIENLEILIERQERKSLIITRPIQPIIALRLVKRRDTSISQYLWQLFQLSYRDKSIYNTDRIIFFWRMCKIVQYL